MASKYMVSETRMHPRWDLRKRMLLGLLPLGSLKAGIIFVVTEPVIALFSGCTRETHLEAAPDPNVQRKKSHPGHLSFGLVV